MSKDLLARLSGAGMQDIQEDAGLPLIKIMQSGSAEVDKTHPKHSLKRIEGASAGDIVFLGRVLPQPLEILVLAHRKCYAEWRSKKEGGGVVAHHPLSIQRHEDYQRGEGDDKYSEYLGDNELKLTEYFMVLFKDGDKWTEGIISMVKSNLKVARALKRMVAGFAYPDQKQYEGVSPFTFSRKYSVTTKLERGDDNSWFEFEIAPSDILSLKSDVDILEQCLEARDHAEQALPALNGVSKQALPDKSGAIDADVEDSDEDTPF